MTTYLHSFSLSIGAIALILVAACLATPVSSTPSSNDQQDLQLPVRIYLMSFDADQKLDSTYKTAHVEKMFAEVNTIWRQWGISWVPERVLPLHIAKQDFSGVEKTETARSFREKLARLTPPLPDKKLWQIAIIRQFPVPAGGVYIREKKTVIFGELNKNGEEHFSVLAHELGHTLGLRHVEDENNLMTGSKAKDPRKAKILNVEQITQARSQALVGPLYDKSPGNTAVSNREQQERISNKPDANRRKQIVNRLLSFDSDGDGMVSRQDVPSKSYKVFNRIDRNNNDMLEESELRQFMNK